MLLAWLGQLLKACSNGKVLMKLQAIHAVSHSPISTVSKGFGVAQSTLKFWIRIFEKQGIKGLESKVKNPRKPKLTVSQIDQVRLWVENDATVTMKKLQAMIKQHFNVEISEVGVWKNVKK